MPPPMSGSETAPWPEEPNPDTLGGMPPKRRGNPKGSPWYSTPDEKRGTVRPQFSLDPDVDAMIEALAEEYGGRSAVVEAAVRELYGKRPKR